MRWLKRVGLLIVVLALVGVGVVAWASANTDTSQTARVLLWLDSDVDDWQRFPARAMAASDAPRELPTPAEPDPAVAAFTIDDEPLTDLSLIHISEPTRRRDSSRMPSSA